MIKSCLLLLLSFSTIYFFSGCSNPVTDSESLSDNKARGETSELDRSNTAALEFYVHRYIPNSPNSAVRDAFVEIYNGSTLVYSVGTTAVNGKISLPCFSLPQGDYTVYAYTVVGKYMDLYGYKRFSNNGFSAQISIWVFHV